MKHFSLDELWALASQEAVQFSQSKFSTLPPVARRYLEHAITPGARLAQGVRLRMHGTIKLGEWFPFTAEQVTVWNRGMIWTASVSKNGLPIRGFDRLIDGVGSMRWNMLGLIPVMKADGLEVTRSAIGRMQGEAVWLPSVLCCGDVRWEDTDALHTRAHFTLMKENAEVKFALDDHGAVQSVNLQRWGNPEGKDHHLTDFGVIVEEERTFEGYTILSKIRAGWYFGTDRFANEGEFFRATLDEAQYR